MSGDLKAVTVENGVQRREEALLEFMVSRTLGILSPSRVSRFSLATSENPEEQCWHDITSAENRFICYAPLAKTSTFAGGLTTIFPLSVQFLQGFMTILPHRESSRTFKSW